MNDQHAMDTAMNEVILGTFDTHETQKRGLFGGQHQPDGGIFGGNFKQHGHHYAMRPDYKSGLFTVVHTAGPDRGFADIAVVGKSRDPYSAMEMADKHAKSLNEAIKDPAMGKLKDRMASGKEKAKQKEELKSSKKKEKIDVQPKLEETSQGYDFSHPFPVKTGDHVMVDTGEGSNYRWTGRVHKPGRGSSFAATDDKSALHQITPDPEFHGSHGFKPRSVHPANVTKVLGEAAPIQEAESTSKKHYIAIAKILHDMSKEDHGDKETHSRAMNRVRSDLSDIFKADNPRFDHERFHKASLPESAINELDDKTLDSYWEKAHDEARRLHASAGFGHAFHDKMLNTKRGRAKPHLFAYLKTNADAEESKGKKHERGVDLALKKLAKHADDKYRGKAVKEDVLREEGYKAVDKLSKKVPVTEAAKDGSTPVKFNIGTKKGRTREDIPLDDIRKSVEAHGFKIDRMRVKTRGGNEPTAIVSTHTHHAKSEVPDHVMAMTKELGQEAIAARHGKRGHLVGPKAADWGGKFIGRFFTENEELIMEALSKKTYVSVAKKLHDALNDKDSIADMDDAQKQTYHNSIRGAAHALSDYFASDNPHFDRDRFHKAAGVLDEANNEEELNELSPSTLGSYIKSATADFGELHHSMGRDIGRLPDDDRTWKSLHKRLDKADNREAGIARATKKLVKKSIGEGELNELHPASLGRYISFAAIDKAAAERRWILAKTLPLYTEKDREESAAKARRRADKRLDGILNAQRKLVRKALKEASMIPHKLRKNGKS